MKVTAADESHINLITFMCTETVCVLSFRQYSARNLAHRQVIGHYLMGPVENTVIDLFHPGKAAQIQAQENLLLTTTG